MMYFPGVVLIRLFVSWVANALEDTMVKKTHSGDYSSSINDRVYKIT